MNVTVNAKLTDSSYKENLCKALKLTKNFETNVIDSEKQTFNKP